MYIITMLILLSILVLIHELGHFSVARMLGIKVERFGFGLPFGPTLFETTWGETKICIHALLLGGYVSFPDDDPDSPLPKDDPGRISNRKVWERALVISAGVVANTILAYLIVLFVAGFSGGVPSGKYNVYIDGLISGKSLSANTIGIKQGDKLLSSNGVQIDSPYKFIQIAQINKAYDGYATPEEINTQFDKIKKLNPTLPKTVIPKGVKVQLASPAYESPLNISDDAFAGAKKSSPDGVKLTNSEQKLRDSLKNKSYYISDGQVTLSDIATATADNVHPVNITVLREGKQVKLKPAFPNDKGLIGIKLKSEEVMMPAKNPVQAIKSSWSYLVRNVSFMLVGLGMILTNQIPLTDLHGIVAITKVGGDIIQKKGIWDGLLLTALISIDLAIVNILPIPALDGGHLFFLLIEAIKGKPVDEKIQETFAKFGFIFLIGIMILIIFNDIFALLTDKL